LRRVFYRELGICQHFSQIINISPQISIVHWDHTAKTRPGAVHFREICRPVSGSHPQKRILP